VQTEAALAGCIQLAFELRGFDVASGLRQQKAKALDFEAAPI
jgi:hypothetical protein